MASARNPMPQTLRAQQHSVADSALSETQIPRVPGSPQSEEAASGSGLSGHHSPVRISIAHRRLAACSAASHQLQYVSLHSTELLVQGLLSRYSMPRSWIAEA